MKRFTSAFTATGALVLLAACAGEPPRAELGAADAAIQAAQHSGAGERAPVDLNNARMKYQSANVAVRDGDYDRAKRLASEAEIDAQLAGAKADAEASKAAAQQVHQDATTLQRETAPVSSGPPVSLQPQTTTSP